VGKKYAKHRRDSLSQDTGPTKRLGEPRMSADANANREGTWKFLKGLERIC
jgi:hypothetical protein